MGQPITMYRADDGSIHATEAEMDAQDELLRGHANMSASPNTTSVRLLDRREVEARVCLSRGSLYRYVKDGSFPPPTQIGKRRIGWPESVITAWIEARPTGTREAGTSPRNRG